MNSEPPNPEVHIGGTTDEGRGHIVPARVSVRDAARVPRKPNRIFAIQVRLVGALPELGLTYVQDQDGRRFLVDNNTRMEVELVTGSTYRAVVNDEGYVLSIGHDPTQALP